jgi:hypothetical protein
MYCKIIIISALIDVGSASFKYDMRRLSEILALPRAWYRRTLARRLFLGEELAMRDDESGRVYCIQHLYTGH